MSHNHNHMYNEEKGIKTAFILNFTFAIIEIVGGVITNSISIISDALHDLGDSISLAIAWYLERYSNKKADEKYTFGYARFSLLGALVSSIILILGSTIVLYNAIPRIFNPEDVNPEGMIIFAIIGIIANGAGVIKLKKGSSYNSKMVMIHLLEDLFGWVAVLIISVILLFINIPILDALLSVAITIYILYNVWKKLKEIMSIFLQGVPVDLSVSEIEKEVKKNVDILNIYHTHLWTLEGNRVFLSTHIIVKDDAKKEDISEIKKDITKLMKNRKIDHITIQVDYDFEENEMNDNKCI